MKHRMLLLTALVLMLGGLVAIPAGAVDPVYEVDFNTQTGTLAVGTYTIVGSAVGNSTSAEGEFIYDLASHPTLSEATLRIYDLKCLVVEPSTNLSYDTDFNVMAIGRLDIVDDPGDRYTGDTWGYVAFAPDEERFSGQRPIGFRAHDAEPPCDPAAYNDFVDAYSAYTWTGNGYLTSGFVTVDEVVDLDADGDGVLDDVDVCPATTLDDPPEKLKKNRFAVDDAGLFVDVNGSESGFTIVDTFGCDEDQIIEMMGLGGGHEKFGITQSVLLTFISMY